MNTRAEPVADGDLLVLSAGPSQEVVAAIQGLVQHLCQSRYERIKILPLPGGWADLPLDVANLAYALAGQDNLFHRSGVPWLYDALVRTKASRLVALHRAFHLCQETSHDQAVALLGERLVDCLLDAGVLWATSGGVRSRVMLTPYGQGVYASDPTSLKAHPKFVYLGRTSFVITRAILQSCVTDERGNTQRRLLDLGCGSGNIGLALSARFEEVLCTDIVERCLSFARLNARLAGVTNCEFRYSDLFDNVDGSFDSIVANPPCGWTDPSVGRPRPSSAGGANYGTELPTRVLAGALERINPAGRIYATLTCPVIGRRPYVALLLEEIFGRHEVGATVYPMFEEYSYGRARSYRRHRIKKMVRYLVVIERRKGRFGLRFGRFDSARLWSYRVRVAIPRLAAAVTGGPKRSEFDEAVA